MRDIRSDLQERETLINEQIKAAHADYERTVEQVRHERDAKIGNLKAGLAMIANFKEFDRRFLGNVPPAQSSPLVALADRFMHRLNEVGSMSREEIVELAVKEGFFADKEQAVQGVHPMLVRLLESKLIRELSNGNYAPPTLSQAIKLRRVV